MEIDNSALSKSTKDFNNELNDKLIKVAKLISSTEKFRYIEVEIILDGKPYKNFLGDTK